MPKIGQIVVCDGSKQNSSGWLVLILPLRTDKWATEWGELPLSCFPEVFQAIHQVSLSDLLDLMLSRVVFSCLLPAVQGGLRT